MLYKKNPENVLLPSQKQNTLQNVGIKTVITLLIFSRCYIYFTTLLSCPLWNILLSKY